MAMPAEAPSTSVKRVAIVVSSRDAVDWLSVSFIADIVARRHRVMCIAPEFSDAEAEALEAMGAEHQTFVVEPEGLRLLSAWKAISALKAILAEWSPHVVVGVGSKPMVYAVLAAKALGTERVVTFIDGLPAHGFDGSTSPGELPAWRYGQILDGADAAIFCNRDDASLLSELGLLPTDLPVTIVPGLGIDLGRSGLIALPELSSGLVFLMSGALDRRKGVIEYCQAAQALRERSPNSRFLLAGTRVEGPHGVDLEELTGDGAAIEYLGPSDDIRSALAQCHVFVCPSHAEGMPRSLLEAMAAGRPIITTNVAGCRDTVDERVNGCLVAPRDALSLEEAIASFLKRPDLIPAMARASRAKAERFCDARDINQSLFPVLGLD